MRTPLPSLAGLLLIATATHAQDSALITLPEGTRILTQLQQPFTTRLARPGDSLYLQTTFPVTGTGGVLIPAGTHVLATLDRVQTRARSGYPSVELDVHLASLVYANGYIISTSSPAHGVSSSDSRMEGDGRGVPGLGLLAFVAPAAGVAIGMSGGQHGAEVGGMTGSAVGAAFAIAAGLSFHRALRLEAGLPIEVVLRGSLTVDQRRAAIPAPPGNMAVTWPAPLRHSQDATPHQCYNPGTPGTPDIVIPAPQLPPTVIPGAPGTPDIVIPAPQLPPTIIPGTPATLGFWYSCP
jgi:hypothetical protein